MKTQSIVRWLLLGFAFNEYAIAVAADADGTVEVEVRSTNELQLIGIIRSDPSFTIFVSHSRAKPQPLHAIGTAIGPYELRAVDPDRGFADFEREGSIYRVWLPEAVVRPGRFRPIPVAAPRMTGVTIVGSVNNPALVPHYEGLTIADAISMAGGANRQADLKRVKLRRRDRKSGEMILTEIDVAAIVANSGRPVVPLARGDVVEVPERAP